ncbi:hypothetical protein Goari_004970 [Gossypium aridum]|uniref:CCHC-type domain-containing protein n=1 Tax=Gossypium aridum TaxID=34290 RepID=A0A7J8Y553_GOSAI|nr:hypothetical protein [Gossypium aridum]
MVCFSRGRYGHVKESCPKVDGFMSRSKMLVKRKSKRKSRESQKIRTKNLIEKIEGSRFNVLPSLDKEEGENVLDLDNLMESRNKGKGIWTVKFKML